MAVVVAALGSEIPEFADGVSAATLTFGVVVAGFTATQRTMFLNISATRDNRIIEFLVKTARDDDVLFYLNQCIQGALFVCVISLARFFLDCTIEWVWLVWLGIWSSSVAFVLVSLHRNERLMFVLVREFMRDLPKNDSSSPRQ